MSFLRQLSTVCFKNKRLKIGQDRKEEKWYFSYNFGRVTEFLGKDLKLKAQNYPIHQILS